METNLARLADMAFERDEEGRMAEDMKSVLVEQLLPRAS